MSNRKHELNQMEMDDFGPVDDDEFLLNISRSTSSADGRVTLHKKRCIVGLHTWWIGVQMMWIILPMVVLPSQIRSLVGDARKGQVYGIVSASGAIFALVLSPLMGAVSDRAIFPWGRRRPFMLGGMCMLTVALLVMALAARVILPTNPQSGPEAGTNNCSIVAADNTHTDTPQGKQLDEGVYGGPSNGSLLVLILGYVMLTVAYTVQSVPYNGLIADVTDPVTRGMSSGIMGTFSTFGNLLGSLAGIVYTTLGVLNTYLVIIAFVWVTGLVTIITVSESKPVADENKKKESWCEIIAGCAEPMYDHDFRWVFFTRFLFQAGVSSVIGLLQYSLADRSDLGDMSAETAVGIVLLPMLTVAALSSTAAGWLSDHWGKRRRALVMGSSFVMAATGCALAFVTEFYVVIGIATCFGLGFGTFLAVDFAMVMDVLPDDREVARDLAVWHSAMVLPNMIAAPLSGVLRDYFQTVGCGCECGLGYIVVFILASVYFLLSGLFVMRIRGIR